MMNRILGPLLMTAALVAGCAGDTPPRKPERRVVKERSLASEKADAKRLFKLMLTVEALEPVVGESDIWKAAVQDMPDAAPVQLLNSKLGGGRFTAFDVEAGTKVYRARFAEIATGDAIVEVLWSIDGKNYPVRIGAPEGYREARATDFMGKATKTLTGWNDGAIDLIVTPDPVIVEWDKGVKTGH